MNDDEIESALKNILMNVDLEKELEFLFNYSPCFCKWNMNDYKEICLPPECPRCGEIMEWIDDNSSNVANYYCKYCAADRADEYRIPNDVKTGLDFSNYSDLG